MKSMVMVEEYFDMLEKLPFMEQVAKLREVSKGPNATIILTSGRCRIWMKRCADIVITSEGKLEDL